MMIHLKGRKSRESWRRRRGGCNGGLGFSWKENRLVLKKVEQQGVAHTLLFQHPGSCWNTAGRGYNRKKTGTRSNV